MGTVRLQYPFDGDAQRLATIRGDAAALWQLLGLVRDIAPGDFSGLPQLYNPCDSLALDAPNEIERAFGDFLAGLGRPDISVAASLIDSEVSGIVGWLEFRGRERDGTPWSLQLAIVLRDYHLVLEAIPRSEDSR
jgi:hypothetical protein